MAKKIKKPETELIQEAIEYRLQGYDYQQIADAMPGINAERAAELVSQGLNLIIRDPNKETLLLDLARTNQMLTAVYGNAASGDPPAIDAVLKLTKHRTTLEAQLLPPVSEAVYFRTIKRGVGQPPHKPTDRTIAQVEAYAIIGLPDDKIAELMDISVPTLKKHYGPIIDGAANNLIALAGGNLWTLLRKADPGATYFTLKTRAKWRETHNLEHSGPDGAPLPAGPPPVLNLIFGTEEQFPQYAAPTAQDAPKK